ncbi:MAG: BamA/TamA family outer membrane protein, partial [Cyclobacteriaceae bacterium]|nr:BamA/TamA family outer membrane protein [Cyclobacteriaceae bacterium]
EIKMEANVEYRFPIVGYLKGALFTDIGNIWLAHEDSLRPGGKFDVDTFYKEIAVGLGVGLRIDVGLVVLRFDWAFPVRKPWLPDGQRWVFDEIDLFNSRWRKNNLLWNISIGYPF